MAGQSAAYVHGYDLQEAERLADQASALELLLHHDTVYPPGSRVLEVGCGVGAQTVALARRSPGARFVAVDLAASSVATATERVRAAGLLNVEFLHADALAHDFGSKLFDHAFVCFVLEHVPDPEGALLRLQTIVRPGGTITAIEGDHGTTCLHPDSEAALAAVRALVSLQRTAGGDANIGRRLYALCRGVGLEDVKVSPRLVYVDGARPALAQAFTRRTFAAMIAGVRQQAIDAGLIGAARFDEGIQALHRAAEPDGSFQYTFFKAVASVPSR